MAFRLNLSQPLAESFHEIATETIRGAIECIDAPERDDHDTIHEVRRRCKQIRGLLRLARGPLEEGGHFQLENESFRDASREISEIRDAEALIETYDHLMEVFAKELDRRAFGTIRRRLTLRKNDLAERFALVTRLVDFRAKMEAALPRVDVWTKSIQRFEDLKPGLAKVYKRGVADLAAVRESPHSDLFHEWRKRVKYHRFHCALVFSIWPPVMQVRLDELDRLASVLGREHDLTVFQAVLTKEKDRFGAGTEILSLVALAERHQVELRKIAIPLGRKLFSARPNELAGQWIEWENAGPS